MRFQDCFGGLPHVATRRSPLGCQGVFFAFFLASSLFGCGDDEAPAGPAVVGCDEVDYDGSTFSGFDCGSSPVRRTLTSDGRAVTFLAECEAGCLVEVFVRPGSPGDGGMEPGDGDGDGDGQSADGPGLGEACEANTDCAAGLACDRELGLAIDVDGLPDGEDQLPQVLFPGGSCTPNALAPYSMTSCDPLMPRMSQGCGEDGVCVPEVVDQQTLVACRAGCDPSDPGACGRDFYTCDFSLRACIEGCQSDEECRLQLVDNDADGVADSLVYDGDSGAVCDRESFRCVLDSGDGGNTGDACVRRDDCEAEGNCISELQTFGGFTYPDGFCTKLGCDVDGRECSGDNSVCTAMRTWNNGMGSSRACMTGCRVGAEDEADRIGADGHGDGCRPGYRCHYNGGSGARAGVCVGGNYNEVDTPNLGVACEGQDDCYSPFGLGRCLSLQVGSVVGPAPTCTIMDCAIPGLPDDICGPDGQCIALNDDVTFCARSCTKAEECAEGFGCADDDGDGTTAKLCFPACFEDADCREDERCAVGADGLGTCAAQ